MRYKLKSKPKNPTIVEGFPGFGLVGTIATEYLIKHLDAKKIGYIRAEEIAPTIAVHAGEPVEPLGIFYSKKKNLLILHALANVAGFEWDIAEVLAKISKDLKCKEIISLEGVGSETIMKGKDPVAYYLTHNKKFKSKCGEPLDEGIIVGVTGALIVREDVKNTCIFAETHSTLPDSRAAAKILCVLDEYLKLGLDYKPLIKRAEQFEGKLKDVMSKAKKVSQSAEEKSQSYFG